MKKKRSHPIRIFFIFLLFTAVIYYGWHTFIKTGTKFFSNNSFYSISADQSIDHYNTVSMDEYDIYRGNLILINAQNAYQDWGNNKLISVYDLKNTAYKVRDKNILLNEEVIYALNKLMDNFHKINSDNAVNVISGYRTENYQRELFEEMSCEVGETEAAIWVANPGFSEHHSGLALDLGLYFDDGTSQSFNGEGKYSWITENCWKYGFVVRYPENKQSITKIAYEPWHLRYVGIPHAFMMKETGLCFEEYIDFIQDYQFGTEHLVVSANGGTYEIYFATGMEVPVPENEVYKVSGNNVNGFFVTIEK